MFSNESSQNIHSCDLELCDNIDMITYGGMSKYSGFQGCLDIK